MSRNQQARELYPTSLAMQKQWLKWTRYLYFTRKHIVLTGAYPLARV